MSTDNFFTLINKKRLTLTTASYEEWLLKSLANKQQALAYLNVALNEYTKDKDFKALIIVMEHIIKASRIRHRIKRGVC